MTRSQYIKYGVITIGIVLLFFLLLNIFGGKGHTKLYEKLAASEEREKAAIEQRDFFRDLYNKSIREGEVKDSLLLLKEEKVIVRYEKIPAAVRDLSKDGLRSAFTNY